MSLFSGGITALGQLTGDTGTTSLAKTTKNAGIDSAESSLLSNVNASTPSSSTLSSYITNYLANYPTESKNTKQETGVIDSYYNGSAANALSDLRGQRSIALTNAANLAGQQALRAQNLSAVGGAGGGGSYWNRQALGNLTNVQTQAALDNANQARSDWGTINQGQLSLLGQRNNLTNNLSNMALAPYANAQSLNSAGIQNLSGITNIDNANNIYGLKYDPSLSEIMAQADQNNPVSSVIGQVRGSGGGSSSGSSSPTGQNLTTWGNSSGYIPTTSTSSGWGGSPSFSYGNSFSAPSSYGNAFPTSSYGYGLPVGSNATGGMSYDPNEFSSMASM